MKIIFFGSGYFSVPVLKKILYSGNEILCVVTQPDKRKGRGWSVSPTPIKAFMEQTAPHIELVQPISARDNSFYDYLSLKKADLFVVVDYGQILSREVLSIPKLFCINLHPSLLPQYRGASPINRAIQNGDNITGNTVIKMSIEMDAGEIITQENLSIQEGEDSITLFERLSQQGAGLLIKSIRSIEENKYTLTKQAEEKISYAPKLKKQEGEINWEEPAEIILRKMKAFKPWPGIYTSMGNYTFKILNARVHDVNNSGEPKGMLLTSADSGSMLIQTGNGIISLLFVQLEGKKAMSAEEFLKGHRLEKGLILGHLKSIK
ncbi:methionyl-tRNA formyltransferase [Candidatus Omnitrophus magneticus]|uniref:Methionyl-tRNA formyltransferase n=1 Tax=Candidatus Omnitrophus magneticus TaxID=1609969 RepID=A0A0F0CW22_9BACT|nr:methionyl-tRNA formyltransferase [Candidatus Omnitrophus magneticus]